MIHTLEADNILLEFGLRRILSDIHIQCRTGKITGLLGRNGQGKTCLIRIIYGDLGASSRSVRFDNISLLQAYKQPAHVLYLPQFNFIPGSLTLQRVFDDFNLEFRDLEQRFPQFRAKQKSRINDLSGGERRLITDHLYRHVVDIADKFYILVNGKTQLAQDIGDIERLGYARL